MPRLLLLDSIESSLQSKFHTEKLVRSIQECDDINLLREIAIELLKINEQKTAIAHWATRQAGETQKSQEMNHEFLN